MKFHVTYHTIAAEGRASFKFVRMRLNDSKENPCHVRLNFFEQIRYVASKRIEIHKETEAANEAPLNPRDVK